MTERTSLLVMWLLFLVGLESVIVAVFGILEVPGLLMLGVTLILLPSLAFVFFHKAGLSETTVLLSILVPLVLMNYVYTIRMGFPVGLDDVHSHIYESQILLDSQGHIDFSQAQSISFNFVGLYIVAWFLESVSSTDIATVAVVLPPLINMTVIVSVYILVRRVIDPRAAILTTILFGWENITFVFGSEFRTQTVGTLFTLSVLFFYVARQTSRNSGAWVALVTVLLLFSLSTVSLVSVVFALVMFLSFAVVSGLKGDYLARVGLSHVAFLVSFFLFYVLYVSVSSVSILGAFVLLVRDAFSATPAATPSIGQEIYGPVVRWFVYGFWGLFVVLVALMAYFRTLTSARYFPLFVSLSSVFIIGITLSLFFPLNFARGYTVGAILIGLVVAVGLLTFAQRGFKGHVKIAKTAACLLVISFVVVSFAKFPVYIVTGVPEIRGHEAIDDVPYWRVSDIDFVAADFLESHGQGKVLHLHMLVRPYMLLELYQSGLLYSLRSFDYKSGLEGGVQGPGDLVLLRDEYAGRSYLYRDQLPTLADYDRYSLVYSNGDYLVYAVTP